MPKNSHQLISFLFCCYPNSTTFGVDIFVMIRLCVKCGHDRKENKRSVISKLYRAQCQIKVIMHLLVLDHNEFQSIRQKSVYTDMTVSLTEKYCRLWIKRFYLHKCEFYRRVIAMLWSMHYHPYWLCALSSFEKTLLKYFNFINVTLTTCLVWWLARLTVIQEVPGSIPGYTLEIFLEVKLKIPNEEHFFKTR